ncbi:hypothetical protein LMG31506_00211 [Cupriavidus yeoncheonensis]|uniref:DUF1376 domain-containing protein n=1 Tax=Cupriavidus yeoncheonensis TaxID=1462994 RepID=A0A916N1E0_9BURK|nr:hypothetical protein [Cupriavidus yeoncheonensis]CAG2126865.1 hypothetical protein LMG31506_00211 [Cupriavidus yeoncheonensis]
MANPWFRMYSEFATDAKVQSMSEAMQRRLMMLFCLRCSNALATLQEDELAFALRLSDEDLAETKALFTRKGFVDAEWNIRNWDKRQFASDSSTERSRKHRQGKKNAAQQGCNVAATAPDTDSEADTEADNSKVHKGQSGSASPPAASGKATRLPKEWVLPKGWGEWALKEQPSWTAEHTRHVADMFRDHWHAKGGADARKADWEATWRNWVRREGPMAGGSVAGANTGATTWWTGTDAIKAKAAEHNVVWREDRGELFRNFRVRVFKAAGEGPWREMALTEAARENPEEHARIFEFFYGQPPANAAQLADRAKEAA